MQENNLETIDKQNIWYACCMYIYQNVFKPDHNLRDNRKCIIPYDDIESIKKIYDNYVYNCMVFGRMITLYGFSKMIGISEDTIWRYSKGQDALSLAWSELFQKVDKDKEQTLNNKLFDSNNVTGQAILVNHYYNYNLPGVTKEHKIHGENQITDARAAFETFRISGDSD